MAHEQNYVPHPQSDVPPSGCTGGSLLTGSGAPVCPGFEGQSYIDASSGDLYLYTGGSWTLISSGGGGGSVEVYAADYSGVAPVFVPAGSVAIATDTVTGTTWYYYSGSWH